MLTLLPSVICLFLDTLVLKTGIPALSLVASILAIAIPTAFYTVVRRRI